MDFFKKHADAIVTISVIVGSLVWMNGKFNELEKDIAKVDKEVSILRTVMIMKNIMPNELVHEDKETRK